jgi:glycosyltransferase involved in cell wall biosynthesis
MQRLKVLMSAYSCRPGQGSEPGIGWNLAKEVAAYHDVLVLTLETGRRYIESEMKANPIPGLRVAYCELPAWLGWLNRIKLTENTYYCAWQVAAYRMALRMHTSTHFDVANHVTFGRYWSPSFISLLPVPFIFGPVGGGESAPQSFRKDFSLRGKLFEFARSLGRRLGELDPFVRLTARRSAVAYATSDETATRLRKLGARNVEVSPHAALPPEEIEQLDKLASPQSQTVRFISIGRHMHWKGFHLGLKAFARASLPENARYHIIGTGPERARLEQISTELGITEKVTFHGALARSKTLEKLAGCTALIHPSLHESGGWVCLEAMAAGCPVICLDMGGPALIVTEETGCKIDADTPEEAVAAIAKAMTILAADRGVHKSKGKHGKERIKTHFNWKIRGEQLAKRYSDIVARK